MTSLIEMIADEIQFISAEQINLASEYVSVGAVCDCSKKVKELQEELAESKESINRLTEQVEQHLPPFCEESFVSDDFTQTHTGLPNLRMVKAIFHHVSKTLPLEKSTKLSSYVRID